MPILMRTRKLRKNKTMRRKPRHLRKTVKGGATSNIFEERKKIFKKGVNEDESRKNRESSILALRKNKKNKGLSRRRGKNSNKPKMVEEPKDSSNPLFAFASPPPEISVSSQAPAPALRRGSRSRVPVSLFSSSSSSSTSQAAVEPRAAAAGRPGRRPGIKRVQPKEWMNWKIHLNTPDSYTTHEAELTANLRRPGGTTIQVRNCSVEEILMNMPVIRGLDLTDNERQFIINVSKFHIQLTKSLEVFELEETTITGKLGTDKIYIRKEFAGQTFDLEVDQRDPGEFLNPNESNCTSTRADIEEAENEDEVEMLSAEGSAGSSLPDDRTHELRHRNLLKALAANPYRVEFLKAFLRVSGVSEEIITELFTRVDPAATSYFLSCDGVTHLLHIIDALPATIESAHIAPKALGIGISSAIDFFLAALRNYLGEPYAFDFGNILGQFILKNGGQTFAMDAPTNHDSNLTLAAKSPAVRLCSRIELAFPFVNTVILIFLDEALRGNIDKMNGEFDKGNASRKLYFSYYQAVSCSRYVKAITTVGTDKRKLAGHGLHNRFPLIDKATNLKEFAKICKTPKIINEDVLMARLQVLSRGDYQGEPADTILLRLISTPLPLTKKGDSNVELTNLIQGLNACTTMNEMIWTIRRSDTLRKEVYETAIEEMGYIEDDTRRVEMALVVTAPTPEEITTMAKMYKRSSLDERTAQIKGLAAEVEASVDAALKLDDSFSQGLETVVPGDLLRKFFKSGYSGLNPDETDFISRVDGSSGHALDRMGNFLEVLGVDLTEDYLTKLLRKMDGDGNGECTVREIIEFSKTLLK